jgi:hypothetical protein
MQHFIYHKSGERIIVETEQFNEMLKTGEWFPTPLEAEKAHNADLLAIEEEELAKSKGKSKSKEKLINETTTENESGAK